MDAAIVSENWLPVIGFEGRYEISDQGSIRSIARHTRSGRRGGSVLSQFVDKDGYRYVVIRDNLKRPHMKRIQRLVAEAFIRPIPAKHVVCHNNGVKSDNSVGNLRIDTQRANIMDCKSHGSARVGVLHGMAKINEQQVAEIRQRRQQGETCRSIADSYGITRMTISAIVHRRLWRHVP